MNINKKNYLMAIQVPLLSVFFLFNLFFFLQIFFAIIPDINPKETPRIAPLIKPKANILFSPNF